MFVTKNELFKLHKLVLERNQELTERVDRILENWKRTVDLNTEMLETLHEGNRIIHELKEERDSLARRLQHLCSNPDIAAYDEVDRRTGEYILDINKPLYEQHKEEDIYRENP